MPGEPLKPGAIYNSNRFTLRALIAGPRLRLRRPRHRPRPARRDPRRAAPRRRRPRPDRHLAAASRSARKTTCGRRCRPKATSTSGRSRSSRASRWRSARCGGADGTAACFIGLPGNPVSSFVTFLLAVRPLLLRLQGATGAAARGAAAARRLRLAAARPAARVPARAPQRRRRPRPVPEPELGRADLGGLGRRPGRQSARPARSARGDIGAPTCRSPSCSR